VGNIILLDELTANQIAAGEVVERPASVVKELVENSIDAGSKNITVEIKNGGVALIRVTDNGAGMDSDDVQVAFERHATSKIRGPKDLEAIRTFGFRGEALASIASVSNIKLLTKREDQEEGTLIELSGGKVVDISPAASPNGTTIAVSELFFNTPARFKFLKKDATEAGHISDTLSKIALGNHEIAFKLINNQNLSFQTPGNGDLKSAIFSIYGKETTHSLIPVFYENKGIKVSGVVGKPELCRSSRNHQLFYINKRSIKSKIITAALDSAFKTYLMKNKYAFAVLNLEINPHLIDVNVHPAKLEVRFSEEQEIFRAVYNCVNAGLLKGDSEKEIFNNNLNHFTSNRYATSSLSKDEIITSGKKESVPSSLISPRGKWGENHRHDHQPIVYPTQDKGLKEGTSAREHLMESIEVKEYQNFIQEDRGDNFKLANRKEKDSDEIQKDISFQRNHFKIPKEKILLNSQKFKRYHLKFNTPKEERMGHQEIFKENDQVAIHKEISQGHQRKIFNKDYLVIGQIFQTFIIIQQEKEIFLIDQHAAHERILFEQLKKKYDEGETLLQMILNPIPLQLTLKETTFVKDHQDLFEKTGFLLEDFGQNSFSLRSVPFGLKDHVDERSVFLEILDYLIHNYTQNKAPQIMDEALYKLACKSAVKANMKLSDLEVETLIEDLEKLQNPHTCPHGRPTVLKLSRYEIEKLFKRIV
jgi:DNA mismatch repair protein MutL